MRREKREGRREREGGREKEGRERERERESRGRRIVPAAEQIPFKQTDNILHICITR